MVLCVIIGQNGERIMEKKLQVLVDIILPGYQVRKDREEEFLQLLEAMYPYLYDDHRDAMIAYYQKGEDRIPMVAQGIFHARKALWAAIRWPENLRLERVVELCEPRTTEDRDETSL